MSEKTDKIKLTPSQKDVVRKMREGEILLIETFSPYRCKWKGQAGQNKSSVTMLSRLGIIRYEPLNLHHKQAQLTTLGQQIEL